MGVQLTEIVPKKEIEIGELAGKKIAIDAFNTLYQFLSIIRDRETGEPLQDSKGRVTSHLSGLFYRTAKFVEAGIRPIFVFDGEAPLFKSATALERRNIREEAHAKWKSALEAGEVGEALKAAKMSARLTGEMIEHSKLLLKTMGIPFVQAPSEGEAQCAWLCKQGLVYASASQDSDALLFGSPKLIRNLSITGRRKLAKKNVFVQIKPELIELKTFLKDLGITREQLIIIGILIGTDYNPGGVQGYGPKRALEIVKEEKTLENVLKNVEWNFKISAEEIYKFFLNPPVTEKFDLSWKPPQREKILKLMVDEFEFSQERVEKVIKTLDKAKAQQSSLGSWVK